MKRLVLLALVACSKKSEPSQTEPSPPQAVSAEPVAETFEQPEVRIRPAGPTTVRIGWTTPAGTDLNDDAPFHVRWSRSEGLADPPADLNAKGAVVKNGFDVHVAPFPGAPVATLGGEINVVVCDAKTHSVCVPVKKVLELGFVVVKDAPLETKIAIPLPRAKP